MSSNAPTDPKLILGIAGTAFIIGAFIMFMVKLYYAKKAADEEAAAGEATWSPSPAPSPPVGQSDVLTARDKLIQGTSIKKGGTPIQVDEVDINVVSPPTIQNPFTINTDTDPDYTISFDIKVEKNLPGDGTFTVLDRGGIADDNNGRRPLIQITTTSKSGERCAKNTCELNGLEFLGDISACSPLADTLRCQKVKTYSIDKTNIFKFIHKPAVAITTSAGPQAGQDFKNFTIVVNATGHTSAKAKIYWDATIVGEIDSESVDWALLTATWRWAGGQTAVNPAIGSVKVKNAYIFGRALDDEEVAILLNRGALITTSTYTAEPLVASWKFNPDGYESD